MAISPGEVARGVDLSGCLAHWATARVDAVQIREKDLDDRRLLEVTSEARRRLPGATRLLVNGRLDIALAAGADGVHLPSRGFPVAALRERFGPGPLLGRSTHELEEIERAREDGADYVTFGPVFATPGKERYGSPQGLERLREATRLGLPVYALGGVTIDVLEELAAAGAAGVAGIRSFGDDRLPELLQLAHRLFDPRARPDPPDA